MTTSQFGVRELRKLLDDSLLVRHISVSLATCDMDDDASAILETMERQNYDVVGVNQSGGVSGYIRKQELSPRGKCRDYCKPLVSSVIIASETPIIDLLALVKANPFMFVLDRTAINGIVTRSDLQKSPVRMLLFGLTSLLEMCLLTMVRAAFPNGSFAASLSANRLEKATGLLKLRKQRNEDIDLADFLDSLVNAFTQKPPEVRIEGRLKKMLAFGEWVMRKDSFGCSDPCTLATNIGKHTLGHTQVVWTAYAAHEIKLDGPFSTDMSMLRPGESGEICLTISSLLDERKHLPILAYIVIEHTDDLPIGQDEPNDGGESYGEYDDEVEAGVGGGEFDRPIKATAKGLAGELLELENWTVNTEVEDDPLVSGTIAYKPERDAPEIITSRRLRAVVYRHKGKPLGMPVGFANPFALVKGQKVFAVAQVDVAKLGARKVANVSSVVIHFEGDDVGGSPAVGAVAESVFIDRSGKVVGPFSPPQAKQLADGGFLLPTDKVSQDNCATWVVAGQIKELFDVPKPARAADPSPVPATAAKVERWFYAKAGKKVGPVTMTDLKQLSASGQLLPTDMVLQEGSPKWISAQQVPGLFS